MIHDHYAAISEPEPPVVGDGQYAIPVGFQQPGAVDEPVEEDEDERVQVVGLVSNLSAGGTHLLLADGSTVQANAVWLAPNSIVVGLPSGDE